MSEEKSQDFPEHWQETTLGEILKVVRGVSFPSEDKKQSPEEDHIACLRTANVQETVDWDDLWYIPEEHISREEQYVRENDILISTANSYELVGKVSLVRDLPERATLGAFISLIRVPEGLDSKFFFYQLRSTEVRNEMRQRASTTTNISNISTSDLNDVPLGVPALPEQRRIVAKIEELFSNLDAGMGDLQTAEQQLERYRLSVLQAAVEGRLTADWRKTHDPEPADQLLEQILEERREQWEKHYRWSRYDSKGKEPPSGWKDRYDEREKPKMSDSPLELPESWTWASADQIGRVETGSTPKTSVDEYYGGEYPFYRPGDLEAGLNTAEAEKTLTEEGLKEARPLPEKSTLITCIGSIGKSGMIRRKGASNQQINAIIPTPSMVPEYIYFAVNSPHFQVLLEERASATTMSIINKGKTKTLPLPLPPLAEQKRIVDEVERLLSVANDASDTADREHTRAERLRQSILKQAFSGQLVPHDDGEAPPIPGTSTTVANGKDDQESRSPMTDENTTEGSSADGDDLLDGIDESNQIEMDL